MLNSLLYLTSFIWNLILQNFLDTPLPSSPFCPWAGSFPFLFCNRCFWKLDHIKLDGRSLTDHLSVLNFRPHYNLNLQSISVNGQMLPIDPAVFATSSGKGTIVDSGTTLAYLAEEAYDPFVNAVCFFWANSQWLTILFGMTMGNIWSFFFFFFVKNDNTSILKKLWSVLFSWPADNECCFTICATCYFQGKSVLFSYHQVQFRVISSQFLLPWMLVFSDDLNSEMNLYFVLSVNDVFPQVSLNFAGGASMNLRPQDYLLQQNSVVSFQVLIFLFYLFNCCGLVWIYIYFFIEITGELKWVASCLFSWTTPSNDSMRLAIWLSLFYFMHLKSTCRMTTVTSQPIFSIVQLSGKLKVHLCNATSLLFSLINPLLTSGILQYQIWYPVLTLLDCTVCIQVVPITHWRFSSITGFLNVLPDHFLV